MEAYYWGFSFGRARTMFSFGRCGGGGGGGGPTRSGWNNVIPKHDECDSVVD